MKPGRLDEQPMPLIVTTLYGWICSSTSAFWSAASTPKSPQPGHQSGSTLPLSSCKVTVFNAISVVAMDVSSDHDFVHGHGKLGFPGQLILHCFHDVMRHEGFAVIFADVAVRDEAGFAAQIACELPAVVVFDDDGVARAA